MGWASDAPVPVWFDQLRELSEHWIHRQQLLQSLGQPSDLRSDLAGPILDCLRWAYPYRLSAAHTDVDGDSITINVSGPVDHTWHLVAGSAGWRFAASPGATVVATMDLSTEQSWRLLTNNLRDDERKPLPSPAADTAKCLSHPDEAHRPTGVQHRSGKAVAE